ncbi:hypothetical protein [Echinicola strongylocentroti]|uniref:hypothetical protein n=1 Tax=Echinicola strongylocentroti TaxID=1795355 RepID=UPI001FE9E419|nr:hypothetical protein [Echinicola strongylocentroti]
MNTKDTLYVPEMTLIDLLRRNVAAVAQLKAVVSQEGYLTYQSLEDRSNQLAHLLLETGVSPGIT